MRAQRIHLAASLLIAAGLATFLALSATGHILQGPPQRNQVWASTAKPLLIEWEQGKATCGHCGAEVEKGNHDCAHCAWGFIWTTARCDYCSGAGGAACPECGGKHATHGCVVDGKPIYPDCGGDGLLNCSVCGGDGILGH